MKNNNWPQYSREEIDCVKNILEQGAVNYWTGTQGRAFENEFADYVGVNHAIAVSNGTVALELALMACEIGPGSEVLVTPRTFIASVSAIIKVGATPIFVDVDLDSQNVCIDDAKRKITRKTRAIICVHLAGWPCRMSEIMQLAGLFNLKIIEDCAQAHGARYRGKSVGSFGDVACWSFCQDKIISTGGEGGMVTTNDHRLWEKMWSYKDHGKKIDLKSMVGQSGFQWVHDSFGTNFRLTEIQSAIGRIQLRKLDAWSAQRQFNMNQIWEVAREIDVLRVPDFDCHAKCGRDSNCTCTHAAYKCYVFVIGGEDVRDRLMERILDRGVFCSQGSCPEVYLERAFDNTSLRPSERLPNARHLGESSLMFKCDPTVTRDALAKTCEVVMQSAKALGRGQFG